MIKHLRKLVLFVFCAVSITYAINPNVYSDNPSRYAVGESVVMGTNILSATIEPDNNLEIEHQITGKPDNRADKLRIYLLRKNSPLAGEADNFVKIADKYDIDYTLLPAISGIESSFGIHLLPGSHNPFGWGGGYLMYNSWEECIEAVAKGIANNYPSDIPAEIAPIYVPPNYVKWTAAVTQFQSEILAIEVE